MTKNIYHINTEDNLTKSEYLTELDSFFKNGSEGFFEGVKNVKIYFKYFTDGKRSKGAIVVSNGRGESVIKYKETIWDLYNNGYSVFAFDHRGQGLSGRLVENKPQLGYVDDFEDYVSDLKTFYEKIVKPQTNDKIFLLAHSMGGAIGLRYLEEYPSDFNAAAFSSPLLGIPFPNCLLIRFVFGKDLEFAKGETDYDSEPKAFESNCVTNSKIRYELSLREVEKIPEAKLGGASYRWVKEACKACRKIFRDSSNISIPLLLIQGTDEMIVAPEAQTKFANLLKKKNKKIKNVVLKGARHELLFEKDEYRTLTLNQILIFFEN